MVYTEIQDSTCDNQGEIFTDLDTAKASCASDPDCGGIGVSPLTTTAYAICDRLISRGGVTAFKKGNSYIWRAVSAALHAGL